MKKIIVTAAFVSSLVSLTARAQEAAPAADPAATPAPTVAATAAPTTDSKLQVGITLLPMALGKFTVSAGGESSTGDAAFAYGVSPSVNYFVIPGLSVGLAPQFIFNVKGKDASGDAAKEYDLMARVAYSYPVAPKFSVYGEVLPGYSIISPSEGDSAKGLVVAFGAGAAMDLTDQLFANVGVGYQLGMQKLSVGGTDVDLKTKFLRIALGVGMKL